MKQSDLQNKVVQALRDVFHYTELQEQAAETNEPIPDEPKLKGLARLGLRYALDRANQLTANARKDLEDLVHPLKTNDAFKDLMN